MILGWRPSVLLPWLVQGQKYLQQIFVVRAVFVEYAFVLLCL